MTIELSREEVRKSERLIANTLKLGAYLSFALLIIGVGAMIMEPQNGLRIAKIGIVALLVAPILRILAAIVMYVKERDTKMILVSLWILSVIGLSAFAGIVTH